MSLLRAGEQRSSLEPNQKRCKRQDYQLLRMPIAVDITRNMEKPYTVVRCARTIKLAEAETLVSMTQVVQLCSVIIISCILLE